MHENSVCNETKQTEGLKNRNINCPHIYGERLVKLTYKVCFVTNEDAFLDFLQESQLQCVRI